MSIKTTPCAIIEVEMNGRIYQCLVPPQAPLGELYDALHEMLKHIASSAQHAADKVRREKDDVASAS